MYPKKVLGISFCEYLKSEKGKGFRIEDDCSDTLTFGNELYIRREKEFLFLIMVSIPFFFKLLSVLPFG